jgi:spore maturation protein CgeB
MRIFYAADNSADPRLGIQSNIWRNNLCCTLIDLGHDVIEFNYDLQETIQKVDKSLHRSFIAKNRPKITRELLRQVRQAHSERPVDLFFSYFYDACVMVEGLEQIRAMGTKTVNWYCNGSYQFHLVEEISPHYDWCLVPEKFRLENYRAIGARPIYCQEGANPNIYKPHNVPVEFEVTFVGQAYGERPDYIRHLLDRGVDVRVWGYGWDKFSQSHQSRTTGSARRLGQEVREFLANTAWQDGLRRLLNLELLRSAGKTVREAPAVTLPDKIIGGVLSDSDMIHMYSRSKINLGFSSCGTTHETEERIVQVRLRDFEVPMSGGFYMVEYMEELEEFFDIGKEIVCYSDPEDLVGKIKYYLEHDNQREEIRRAGYKRALRNHTWHQRFEMAFKQMGLGS